MNRHLAVRIGFLFGVIASGCGGSGSEPTPSPLPSPAPTRVARLWLLAAVDDTDPAAPPRVVLLRSDDLGATWLSLADSGLAESTIAIDFRDAEHGVAAGGTVAQRTDDGGRTWLTQLDDPRRAPYPYLVLVGVHVDPSGTATTLGNVIDDRYVNAAAYESYVLAADGSPAQRTGRYTTALAPLVSTCVTASGHGLAVGGFRFTTANLAYSTTLGTLDGGATWDVLDEISGGGATWYGAACGGEQDFWRFGFVLVGGGPFGPPPATGLTIDHSIDGGLTWDGPVDRAGIGAASLSAGSFVDRETGWFCGWDDGGPVVLHTTDAGATLVRQPLPAGIIGDLSSISFLSDRIGAAAGSASGADGRSVPLVLVTTDGGSTWMRASSPPGTSYTMELDIVP